MGVKNGISGLKMIKKGGISGFLFAYSIFLTCRNNRALVAKKSVGLKWGIDCPPVDAKRIEAKLEG
jgi:hypothetical protein